MLQRRGGSGLAIMVFVAVFAAGCGGPIDSRPPRFDGSGMTNSGAGGAVIDPVFDAGMPVVDVGWPAVSGCVSGLPPSPHFSTDHIPPITIGCAGSSTVLLRVSDAAAQGMVFTARLDPPILGLSLDYDADLCASDVDTPISLIVNQLAFRPGASFTSALTVTPVGPPPQPSSVFYVKITAVPIDFTIDPDVIDFGILTTGLNQTMPITITNAKDGAPLDGVFPAQYGLGPFVIFPAPSSATESLQPGESRQMLGAALNTTAYGTFEAPFLISAFPPGTAVDPACGVVRSVTVRAQIIPPGPP